MSTATDQQIPGPRPTPTPRPPAPPTLAMPAPPTTPIDGVVDNRPPTPGATGLIFIHPEGVTPEEVAELRECIQGLAQPSVILSGQEWRVRVIRDDAAPAVILTPRTRISLDRARHVAAEATGILGVAVAALTQPWEIFTTGAGRHRA